MKGLGMSRLQQRFNAAVVTVLTLAGLHGMSGAKGAKESAAVKGGGHPVHRKLLKGKLDGCPAELPLPHRANCSHHKAVL